MAHRKLRSWLTILGIIIGIASIVTLISLAQGLDSEIRSQLSSFGSTTIIIVPGNMKALQQSRQSQPGSITETGILTNADLDAVKRIGGVDLAIGEIRVPMRVAYKDHTIRLSVSGESPRADEIWQTKYLYGTGFSTEDGKLAIIGYSVAFEYFSENVTLGKTIYINDIPFKVVGILEKTGGSAGTADNAIYIPIKTARELAGPDVKKDQLNTIFIKAHEDSAVPLISEEIKSILLRKHRVSEERQDFSIISAAFIAEQIGTIIGLLTLFLGGVAAISLLVGGIGIANAMFTSVLERTREIGILKAVGASNRVILEIFLMESALIGAVGGTLGAILGLLLSFIMIQLGVPSVVTPELAIFSIGFSLFVGLLSGYFPARNASHLEPVEALRYE